jgi:PhoPQ-activated pathogenicity-related protein
MRTARILARVPTEFTNPIPGHSAQTSLLPSHTSLTKACRLWLCPPSCLTQEAYGFWPPALHDYVNDNVTRDLYTEQFGLLERIVDPISYRDRLTMPKFLVDSSGDQFFPPDTITVGYGWLRGPTYYRSVPNENHFMIHSNGVWNAVQFFRCMVEQQPYPELSWDVQYSADGLTGTIVAKVRGEILPQEARLWQATNGTARDFRLGIGPLYTTRALLPSPTEGRHLWQVTLGAPPTGFTAFFIEFSFGHVRYSTHLAVVPHDMPFPKPPNDPDLSPLTARL